MTFLFDLPRKEQPGRGYRCMVCGEPGPLKAYEVGETKQLVVAHYQCFAQLLAELTRATHPSKEETVVEP